MMNWQIDIIMDFQVSLSYRDPRVILLHWSWDAMLTMPLLLTRFHPLAAVPLPPRGDHVR